jgi:hypothetical protein
MSTLGAPQKVSTIGSLRYELQMSPLRFKRVSTMSAQHKSEDEGSAKYEPTESTTRGKHNKFTKV